MQTSPVLSLKDIKLSSIIKIRLLKVCLCPLLLRIIFIDSYFGKPRWRSSSLANPQVANLACNPVTFLHAHPRINVIVWWSRSRGRQNGCRRDWIGGGGTTRISVFVCALKSRWARTGIAPTVNAGRCALKRWGGAETTNVYRRKRTIDRLHGSDGRIGKWE